MAIFATTDGKLELEYGGQEKTQEQVIEKLIQKAVLAVFKERVKVEELDLLVSCFQEGWWVEVSDDLPAQRYVAILSTVKGMKQGIGRLNVGESPGEMASAIELILEGLHLSNKLNKDVVDGKVIYNEAHKVQPVGRNPEMV
jgi:magnesium chelatase subunit I